MKNAGLDPQQSGDDATHAAIQKVISSSTPRNGIALAQQNRQPGCQPHDHRGFHPETTVFKLSR